ncbi:hypothetical protein EGJ34_17170 [Stenotrophomonas sp. 278]|nr:hypothetical protein EGJ34_17170 [Stenotrophomonas sp. 278]
MVVSAVHYGWYWRGVVHIFRSDSTHLRTLEVAARSKSMVEAEEEAERLGGSYVSSLNAGAASA